MYLIYFTADKDIQKKGEEINLMIYFIFKNTEGPVAAFRRGAQHLYAYVSCICTIPECSAGSRGYSWP